MCILSDEHRVFIAGFHRHFNLKEIFLPIEGDAKMVIGVGTSENSYFIHLKDGSFYTNTKLGSNELTKYFGKQKLYKYDNDKLKSLSNVQMTGKYSILVGSKMD